MVIHSCKPEVFNREVEKIRSATTDQIKNFNLEEVVELSTRSLGITSERMRQGILANLANGADGAGLNRWGLANAFTSVANSDDLTYQDAIDLERAGARIIDLPKADWSKIAGV